MLLILLHIIRVIDRLALRLRRVLMLWVLLVMGRML